MNPLAAEINPAPAVAEPRDVDGKFSQQFAPTIGRQAVDQI